MSGSEPEHPFGDMDEFRVVEPRKMESTAMKNKAVTKRSKEPFDDPVCGHDVNGSTRLPAAGVAEDDNMFDSSVDESSPVELLAFMKQIPGFNGLAAEPPEEKPTFDLSSLVKEGAESIAKVIVKNGNKSAEEGKESADKTDEHSGSDEEALICMKQVTPLTFTAAEGTIGDQPDKTYSENQSDEGQEEDEQNKMSLNGTNESEDGRLSPLMENAKQAIGNVLNNISTAARGLCSDVQQEIGATLEKSFRPSETPQESPLLDQDDLTPESDHQYPSPSPEAHIPQPVFVQQQDQAKEHVSKEAELLLDEAQYDITKTRVPVLDNTETESAESPMTKPNLSNAVINNYFGGAEVIAQMVSIGREEKASPDFAAENEAEGKEPKMAPHGPEVPVSFGDDGTALEAGVLEALRTVSLTDEHQPPSESEIESYAFENLAAPSQQLAEEVLIAAQVDALRASPLGFAPGPITSDPEADTGAKMLPNEPKPEESEFAAAFETTSVSPVLGKDSATKPNFDEFVLHAEDELEEVVPRPQTTSLVDSTRLMEETASGVSQSLKAAFENIPKPTFTGMEQAAETNLLVTSPPEATTPEAPPFEPEIAEAPTAGEGSQAEVLDEMMTAVGDFSSSASFSPLVERPQFDLSSPNDENSPVSESAVGTIAAVAAVDAGEDTSPVVFKEMNSDIVASTGDKETALPTEDINSVKAICEHAVPEHLEALHSKEGTGGMQLSESAPEVHVEPQVKESPVPILPEPTSLKREPSLELFNVPSNATESASCIEQEVPKEEALANGLPSDQLTAAVMEPLGVSSVNGGASLTGSLEEQTYVSLFEEMASVKHPYEMSPLEVLTTDQFAMPAHLSSAESTEHLQAGREMSAKTIDVNVPAITPAKVTRAEDEESKRVPTASDEEAAVAAESQLLENVVTEAAEPRPQTDAETATADKLPELAVGKTESPEQKKDKAAKRVKSPDRKRSPAAAKVATKREQKPTDAAAVIPSPKHEIPAKSAVHKVAHPEADHYATKKAADQHRTKLSGKTSTAMTTVTTTATTKKQTPSQVSHVLKTKKSAATTPTHETTVMRRTHTTEIDTKHMANAQSTPTATMKETTKLSRRTQSHSPASLEKRSANRPVSMRTKLGTGGPHDDKKISKEAPEVADQRRRDAEAAFQMWLQRKDEERRLQKSGSHSTKQTKAAKSPVDPEKRKADAEAAYQAWLHRKREEKVSRNKAPQPHN